MAKPFTIIELDRPRRLRYGLNAMVTVEDMTGKPITKLDMEDISMKDMRTIMYAGLVHEDKQLTPEKVGDLIDEYSDLETAAKKMGDAMTEAFGERQKNQPGPAARK